MEPNIEQFSTIPPEKKPSFNDVIKLVIIIMVVLCVVLIGLIYWRSPVSTNGTKPEALTQTQQISQQAKNIFSGAQIIFPKISSSTEITLKNIPDDIKILFTPGSISQFYKSVRYDSNQKGFLSSFILPNMTIGQFSANIIKQTKSSKWTLLMSNRTDLVGFTEFKNSSTGDEVRVTYIQQNADIKINIQSINTKTNK